MNAETVIKAMQSLASEEKALHLSRFFKTGSGEYGEGDLFLGIAVPDTRKVAKTYQELPLEEVEKLLQSPWHEIRLCGLMTLVLRCKKKKLPEELRKDFFEFYLKHTSACNNWDLVDLTCREVVGRYLVDKERSVLYRLAKSASLWEQRIAIVSTWEFIIRNDFSDTFNLAEYFISHPHDLIHKAVGWMLREVGKRDREALTDFLERHAAKLPRTTLRYAIEHYPESQRQAFLRIKKSKGEK